MNNVEKFILAVLVVVALADFIPSAVNAILALILIGIILMQYPKFSDLVKQIGTLSTGGK